MIIDIYIYIIIKLLKIIIVQIYNKFSVTFSQAKGSDLLQMSHCVDLTEVNATRLTEGAVGHKLKREGRLQ